MCGDGNTERERGGGYVEEQRPERTRGEQLRGDGGPADLEKTKVQCHEHLCDTGMPVRNGNLVNYRNTTNAASVRKQLGTTNRKSNESRHENNGGQGKRQECRGALQRDW